MSKIIKRFHERYKSEVVPGLQKEFAYKNIMEVPRLLKVSLNMGVGDAVLDSKVLNDVMSEMALLSGQKVVATKAKKSMAAFKLREGMQIGCKVTLRKSRMYEFLERLIMIALPRVRDFRGFSIKSFDGKGNFNFGIKEHTIFPEINYDKVNKVRGMNITVTTTAKTDQEAKKLLEMFDFPFNN